MIPVLLRIGPLTVYSYGLMMALGFIVGDIVLSSECKRQGYSTDMATALVVWCAIGGLVGARLLDVLNDWPAYAAHPLTIIFSGAGFVWYGGFIGGVFAGWLVARYFRVGFLKIADMCAPALILGQAFGRMGCLLSGDGDWGLPSKLPWAMAFPHAIVGWNGQSVLKLNAHNQLVSGFYPGVRVQPTPIYESILYVIIFCVLWSLRKKIKIDGRIFYLYLMLEGLERFLVEFVRINPRIVWGLSQAQLVSIVLMIAGAAAWYWSSERKPAAAMKEAMRA
ncbi:MAG: prolipoprotein diacylglyceryl transferase [Candidatus Binataceae bacterium]